MVDDPNSRRGDNARLLQSTFGGSVMNMHRAWWGRAGALLLAGCGGHVTQNGNTEVGGADPFAAGVGGAGTYGAGGAGTYGAGGAGGTPFDLGTGGGTPGPCTTVGTSQERWLTNPEYDNTVRDLLGGP